MSIVVVWASPNREGLTAHCKDQVMKGLAEAGQEAEDIQLNTLQLERCRVCGNGFGACNGGRCIIDDDLSQVYAKLQAAEKIVWITPVYWHDMAEPLKALLDRLRRMETRHNHALANKPCLLIAAAGGSGNGATRALQLLEETLKHMQMVPLDRLPITQFSRSYMLEAIAKAAEAFALAQTEA